MGVPAHRPRSALHPLLNISLHDSPTPSQSLASSLRSPQTPPNPPPASAAIQPPDIRGNHNLVENRILRRRQPLRRTILFRIWINPHRVHQLRPGQFRRLGIGQSAAPRPAACEPGEDAAPVDGFAAAAGADLSAGGGAFFGGLYPHSDQTAPTFAAYSPSHKSCDASASVNFGCLIRSSSHARNGAADIDSAH